MTLGFTSAPAAAKPSVLVMDNLQACLDVASAELSDDFQVITARSGMRGIDAAVLRTPDVILLDLSLPDLDGHAVIAALQQREATRRIPIIFWTASEGPETEVACLVHGAADFIPKSATGEILRVRLLHQVELVKWRRDLSERCAELEDEVRRRREAEENFRRATADLLVWSYALSHDLRGPIAAIKAFSHVALHSDEPRKSHYLRRIEEGADRANGLIDGILECMRIEHSTLRLSSVNLTELVRGIAEELRATHPEAEFTITDLPVVLVDATMMRHIFINLLGNAFKFSGNTAHPKIAIEGRLVDKDVEISVIDNGAGFESTQPDKLFDLFQRAHTARQFSGTGLGLAIVKRLVTRHGGDVRATSVPGERTCVSFTLPALSIVH